MAYSIRLAVLSLLLPASALANGATPAPLPPGYVAKLDPAVASCVLANLDGARTEAAAVLLVQSCATLVGSGVAGSSEGGQILVRCKVAGDPEWVDFRLLTRQQCTAAAGRAQE